MKECQQSTDLERAHSFFRSNIYIDFEEVLWPHSDLKKTEQLKNKHNQTSWKMELAGITRFCLGCMLLCKK
ncbi:hypothetical protein P8452_14717 [Trifolium repens]|nr:hypothetical protein P8452_14717 [Trifolium repens]